MTVEPEVRRFTQPSRRFSLWIAAMLVAIAWGSDQATKVWVERTLALGERIEAIPPVLYWQYHLNPGAAFSIGTQYTGIFTLISVAVLVLGLVHLRKLGGSWLWAIAAGVFLGGVAGNLTDRLLRAPSLQGDVSSFGQGHVVDFIAVPGFAIMNLSDVFIVSSLIGICALALWGPRLHHHATQTKSAPTPDTDASS